MTSPARCYVEISRSRIAANYRAIQQAVGPNVQVMGVVKADAYGHGMVEVARILTADDNGCGAKWLAVSSVAEGIALRQADIQANILVMAGLLAADWDAALHFDLTPVAHSIADMKSFDEAASRLGRPGRFHLKLDTGMGRLGTLESPTEIADAIRELRFVTCDGLLSHFASASDFNTDQTDRQIARFVQLTEALHELGARPRYLHISSTNAIAYARPDVWQAMVRPGHALYGYVSPAQGHAPSNVIDVSPALSWKIKIVMVKDLPAGTLVGYGGSARTKRATKIAVLGAGYADGIPHRLSNRGKVIAGGKFAPILGTVSMDVTTVDITDSPWLKPSDDVTLIGREGNSSQNAQEIARVAGTISYNVLCGIKPRVERIYID